VNPELFYWIGGVLALLAVVVSFLGLREKEFPASGGQIVGVLVVFFVLVLGATTYAVVNARDEQEHREEELAEGSEALAQESQVEELEAEEAGAEGPETASADEGASQPEGAAATEVGMGEYSFDPSEVSVAEGDTVTAQNDGQTVHNLTVLDADEELGATEDVDPGQASELEVDFDPGDYEMVCTIPGHADLGMEGTFTVE
jgi:plastocyanin